MALVRAANLAPVVDREKNFTNVLNGSKTTLTSRRTKFLPICVQKQEAANVFIIKIVFVLMCALRDHVGGAQFSDLQDLRNEINN